MRTLVASDLHLGSQLQGDLLRRPDLAIAVAETRRLLSEGPAA